MRALEEELEEAEERNKITRKEVENIIHEANERQIEQTQSTNTLIEKIVEMQSITMAQVVNIERGIKEQAEREAQYREDMETVAKGMSIGLIVLICTW